MSEVTPSAGCLAADVVRAGLDPLTGRSLSFNHVPMAAWAGHLCDLLLVGALRDVGGTATPAEPPTGVHPLVASAWEHVRPRVPRSWRMMYGPRVVDINRSVAETRHWLVATGMWQQHHTALGWRYAATGVGPDPEPPVAAGDPALRRALMHALTTIAQVGDLNAASGPTIEVADADELTVALRNVLTTTSDLIVWKAARPTLPVGGPF